MKKIKDERIMPNFKIVNILKFREHLQMYLSFFNNTNEIRI